MEDARWLRLVTIGLVLAAIALGYFLVAQKFGGNKVTKSTTQVVQATPLPQPLATMPSILGTDVEQSNKSAYQRIAERTKGGVSELPATGFPAVLIGILAASAAVAGFGLRKFPN